MNGGTVEGREGPQAGAEPKPEEASPRLRQRQGERQTPRVDQAWLLRRSFALNVFTY